MLAYNLAVIRMLAGDHAGAADPARRAYDLSRAGAAGIDPALAELLMARVELATQTWLLNDRELHRSMIEKAVQYAQAYAWEKIARQIVEVYEG